MKIAAVVVLVQYLQQDPLDSHCQHLRPIATVGHYIATVYKEWGVLVCRDGLFVGMLDYSTLKQLPPAYVPQCFMGTPHLACLLPATRPLSISMAIC